MGLRDKVKKGVGRLKNKLSGEHSAIAPDEIKPYERPGVPDEDAKVLMARLKRPVNE